MERVLPERNWLRNHFSLVGGGKGGRGGAQEHQWDSKVVERGQTDAAGAHACTFEFLSGSDLYFEMPFHAFPCHHCPVVCRTIL